MSRRDQWVAGVGLLREFLLDDLALARALKERRWSDLLAAAEIANQDVDPMLAATDPAMYKALRDAITLFYLRGYGCLDVGSLRVQAAMAGKTPSPAA